MKRGIRGSITFKWMLFSILLAAVPLIIATINIVQVYRQDLKESVIALQKEKATRVAEKVRGFLERVTNDLILLSGNPSLSHSDPSSVKNHFRTYISQLDYLFELSLLDERGRVKVRVSKSIIDKSTGPIDSSMHPVFQTAMKGQIYYGLFSYTSDGKPSLTIAIPVGDRQERPVGVLKARIYLAPIVDILHKTKIGERGSSYVMDQEGYLVAKPEEQHILLGPFVDRVISGEEGSLEFEDLRQNKYLVVYKPIHELKWGVIVQVPLKEAYKPLKEITRAAIQWILIASVLGFALSFFLTRRLTQPIQQLSREMLKVSKGDLNVHIQPSTRDEVGDLTESFNKMIQDLKQSQEALQEAEQKYRMIFENSKDMIFITSVDGKFIEVNQAGVEMLGYAHKEELLKTFVRDIYFNYEDRKKFQAEVARKGFAKDFEVMLKRKDNTPLHCLITATGRRDGEGKITGYEGTIKDITARKKIEEDLIQRTEELQTLYQLTVLINQSLELDRVLPVALKAALDLTGFEMGVIYLLQEDGETLELKFDIGHPPGLAEQARFLKKGEGVGGRVTQTKQPILLSIDQYTTSRLLPFLTEAGVKTLAGIPLLSKGESIGAMTLLSRMERNLSERERRLLESIGNQIGMALENANLFSSVAKAKSEWETTFNAVTDLIVIRDKDYRILRGNRSAYIRYGLRPEAMIGKRCYELLHHRTTPCGKCYVTETLRTGRPTSGERESPYLKGIFQYYTYPVRDESGSIVAVVDLAREITEERRLEKEKEVVNQIHRLLASNLDVREVIPAVHTELKKILNSNQMSITLLDEGREHFHFFALDQDNGVGALSKGVLYSAESTPFKKVVDIGWPLMIADTAEGETSLEQTFLKEGIRSLLVYPLEYQGRGIGTLNFGSQAPKHFSEQHFDLLHQIAPVLAISLQNALLLDEIKGSEERYRTVVEGALDGVLIVGEDFRFQFVNDRLTEILGYTRRELIGMDFRSLLDEKSKTLVAERYVQRQKGENVPSQYEFNVVRKDGMLRNVEISARVMKDEAGKVLTIAFLKDITEKKKMEEQLLQTAKLRALGEMASGVAHDFNNALAAILGNTQLLLHTVQDEEVQESLKTIEKVAKDSAQTVKRLQDFTRRKVKQELAQLDVNPVIQDVIEMTKPRWKDEAQRKGIKVEIHHDSGSVSKVHANASEMREVLTNLLLNALEAMPRGGKVEIRTFERSDRVYIQMADSGIGMDEETRQKIFEPFFTTKPFSNTGLGLSVSYGIISRFGGEIEVESQVGKGTTFTITLPRAQEGTDQEGATDSCRPVRTGKPLRILVIDDEETVRNVLTRMLTQCHHQVTVARNGEEGIQLFQQKPFDLVLTDLGMPGVSGWEVCEKIKGMTPTIPVGMITGWGLELDEKKKRMVGLDFVITKPFDFQQILRIVSEQAEQNPSNTYTS